MKEIMELIHEESENITGLSRVFVEDSDGDHFVLYDEDGKVGIQSLDPEINPVLIGVGYRVVGRSFNNGSFATISKYLRDKKEARGKDGR